MDATGSPHDEMLRALYDLVVDPVGVGGLGFRVQDLGFRVQGSGFRV